MKKFPVISENGFKYEVKIKKYNMYWCVEVRKKGFLFTSKKYRNLYLLHHNNFIKMAKESVKDYERSQKNWRRLNEL